MWLSFPALFGPRLDGSYIAQHPDILMKEGRHHHLSIMIGTTSHEGGFVTFRK